MKNIKVYNDRMNVSVNKDEKLFFIDHIDFTEVGTIIDFGGANGSLLWNLMQLCPETTFTKKIIVDNNPQMKTEYPIENCTRVSDIYDIQVDKDAGKVLVIFSSVLHEVSRMLTHQLAAFCSLNADIVVLRDMFYHGGKHPEHKYYEDFAAYEIIRNNPEWYGMFEYIRQGASQYWMQTPEQILTHFILKYTYTENWETEKCENYFSNNVDLLAKMLEKSGWMVEFERNYALPYKAEQALHIFSWPDLPDTHTQRILVKEKNV